MPKICYIPKVFRGARADQIDQANTIVTEYAAQGFALTLRQLYYQFVARGWLENNFRNYKNLGTLVDDGRHAGLIDWNAIHDGTRQLHQTNTWDSPDQIIRAVSEQYKEDIWATQLTRVEVWVEKQALEGIVGQICAQLRVPYFACKGYPSASEVWRAGQRMVLRYHHQGGKETPTGSLPRRQYTCILHLGDHDPSGIDMTRDIEDRLALFCEKHGAPGPTVKRIALNMDQIRLYNPPENPAKLTDSRAEGYIQRFGYSSWELDALSPRQMTDLIRTEIENFRADERMAPLKEQEDHNRHLLVAVSAKWAEVASHVEEQEWLDEVPFEEEDERDTEPYREGEDDEGE